MYDPEAMRSPQLIGFGIELTLCVFLRVLDDVYDFVPISPLGKQTTCQIGELQ
jgi:hypothetical protein